MVFGRVTPERSSGQDGQQQQQQQQRHSEAAISDLHNEERVEKRQVKPHTSIGHQLTVEFTKRRTIVFAVGMGLFLYSVGAALLFVAIKFSLRDFYVMGAGALIIGTIFLGVIMGMRIRDWHVAKKSLLLGQALVRTGDSGYSKYQLGETIVPATRMTGSASSASRTEPSPSSPTFQSEVPQPSKKGHPHHKRTSCVSPAGSRADCAIPNAASAIPPAAQYDRGSSRESLKTEDSVSLNAYQVAGDSSEEAAPPPPVALPRAVTEDSIPLNDSENKENQDLSESVYTEPIEVGQAPTGDKSTPPKPERTSSIASTSKSGILSGLVTPSDVEASNLTTSDMERSVLKRVKLLESEQGADDSCDSEA